MSRRVNPKWRPPLAFVLGGTLAAVFFLPLIGIGYFRVAGNVLGRAETVWMIGWMAFAATVVLGFFLWRLVLRPVRAITDYAQAEGAADVPVHFGTPEFSKLGKSVIAMTQTLQGREAVLRSYADHVTHELKSPLTVVRGAAELLDDPTLAPADRVKMLGNITVAVDRMEALLDGQRALAQAQEPMPRGVCVLSDVIDTAGVVVTQDAQVPFPAELIAVVTTHLIGNAHAHGATKIEIAAGPDKITITDNGPGISQGNRDRIFDPFFTTRRDAGGTGMGLAIVRKMLDAHGATIALADGPGAVFVIRF
jgi:signal transduction histidine kinase